MTEATGYGVDESGLKEANGPSPMQIEIYRRMTPEERLRAGIALCMAMRQLKRAAIRSMYPDWTNLEVNNEVKKAFLYAGD
ncbi:MAG: hypothetical protein HY962_00220 [Ignavibacteriae bacterium]|nr:hypothetical protein [Ignavibacteriota bacterium]